MNEAVSTSQLISGENLVDFIRVSRPASAGTKRARVKIFLLTKTRIFRPQHIQYNNIIFNP